MHVDLSASLTPSLDWLNEHTPMPLLGIAGVTEDIRHVARDARRKRWAGKHSAFLGHSLDLAVEAEPSVRCFYIDVPADLGEAADTAIFSMPAGAVRAADWNATMSGLPSAIAGSLAPWAEAPVRARVREHLGERRLSAVADYYSQRESDIAGAYGAAEKIPLIADTPWHRWDLRRSIFEYFVMLQQCKGCDLPAILGSTEAIRLIRDVRPLFPDAMRSDFSEAMRHAVRFGVAHFATLREGVVEVPGVGLEVQLGPSGSIVAAAPGRVDVSLSSDRQTICLWISGADRPVEIGAIDQASPRHLHRKLAEAGLDVCHDLVADCLRAGLWDRIVTAARRGS